jgi:hypothetical protein
MLCNLSAEYTQASLLEEIDSTGFTDCYDFFYLPIDPVKKTNRGYAFINFLDPSKAWKFQHMYEGRQMQIFNVGKLATVMPAAVQGYLANHAHYANSRVIHGKKDARPLFFRDGNKPSSISQYSMQRRRRTSTNSSAGSGGSGGFRGADQKSSPPSTPAIAAAASPTSKKPEGATSGKDAASCEMSHCPSCGGAHKAMYRFCPFCGHSAGNREL